MPRGRKKSVSGVGAIKVVLVQDPSEEITDVSCGLPPKLKDSRLDLVAVAAAAMSTARSRPTRKVNSNATPQLSPTQRRSPTRQNKQQQSPAKCLRSRITDFFSPSADDPEPPVLKRFDADDDEDEEESEEEGEEMPEIPCAKVPDEDQASDRSEGDSGKENDDQEFNGRTRSNCASAASSRNTSPQRASSCNNNAAQAAPQQSSSKASLGVSVLVNAQNATAADGPTASTSAAAANAASSQGGKQRVGRQANRQGRRGAARAAPNANVNAATTSAVNTKSVEPPARVVTRSRAALSSKPMPVLSLTQPLSVVTSSLTASSPAASPSLSTPRISSPSPMRTKPSSSPAKVKVAAAAAAAASSSPLRRQTTPCSSPSPVRRTATPSSPPTPHKINLVECNGDGKASSEPRSASPVSAAALEKLKISLNGSTEEEVDDEAADDEESVSSNSSTTTDAASETTATGPKKRAAAAAEKPTAKTKLAAAAASSQKVTDFFPIRRSERKPKKTLEEEHLKDVETHLITDGDDYLDITVVEFPEKGRGVVACKDFKKGDFVVEYAGDLIDIGIAKERECQYSLDVSTGCYMYYFKHKAKQYCIDATSESGRLGRLVNHSRVNPNLLTKVVELHEKPRLILVARDDITKGTELLYDYGDRSKESMSAHPWLSL